MTLDKKRISREAAIWHPLRHINVLEFLGVVNISSTTYLVSPWMGLGDLRSFMTSRLEFFRLGPGELGRRASLYRRFKEQAAVTDIASGLAYLHTNDVIHGDLKAANILLDDLLQPKICDFGLTKVLHSSYDLTSKALKWTGSCRWMSPELLMGGDSAVKTTASDIYAFGIVIAEVDFNHLARSNG
ncbi:kinase suppressor of Ras 2 [Tulasnella sp. JGI-2019a]|nr:kinase suppressor of Ras 2 [Tulasnella sp. JGI-2019a]